MHHTPRLRGFTMIEFTLVVAISAILVVGLGALVEAPRMALERDQNSATPSTADRLIARMEQDIRFSADVQVPDPARLEVDREDHTTVAYQWDGLEGGTISMTDASGTTPVLTGVQAMNFVLGTTTIDLKAKDHPVTTTSVDTSSFTEFLLRPGYQLSTDLLKGEEGDELEGALQLVSVSTNSTHVCEYHRLGIAFRAQGLSEPALPKTIRLRPVRDGDANLLVNLYQAGSGNRLAPDRSVLVASAKVLNGSIPAALADLDIAMLCKKKLEPGAYYFLELSGDDRWEHACALNTFKISSPDAIESSDLGLLQSGDSGTSYTTLGAALWAGQIRFAQSAAETKVNVVASTAATVQISTAVHMNLTMMTGDGGTPSISVSFPCQNNVALVNQQ